MASTRFTIRKSIGPRPWVVEDTRAPTYEDARVYLFATQRQARAFIAMIEAEG